MAATKLSLGMVGVHNEVSRPSFYDKTINAFLKQEDRIPLVLGQFFKEETTDVDVHKIQTFNAIFGMPSEATDTAPRPTEEVPYGYGNTITWKTFRNSAVVTETMEKLDKTGFVGMLAGGLLDSMRRFVEMKMANIFNTGLTASGADGSIVFATDHYHENPAAGTWSNIHTSAALSSTALDVARSELALRTNLQGFIMGMQLRKIKVPAGLEGRAKQIRDSEKTPETSTNAINPFRGEWDIVADPYATSTTAWYTWGDLPEAMWGLHMVYFTRPRIEKLAYPTADYPHIKAGWEVYAQLEAGVSVAKNMSRNAGT